MSGLKAGGLALVVGYTTSSENLGKLVSLITHVVDGEIYSQVRYNGPPAWLVEGEGIVMRITGSGPEDRGGMAFCLGRNLMPINPEQDPLEIIEKEKEYAR